MKKWMSWLLVAVLLLSLTACNSPSDTPNDDKADGSTTTTTVTPSPQPLATGEYKNQTITLTYTVTDVVYPWDMRSLEMSQGYAVFYDYTDYDPNTLTGDTWNLLDRNGNRVLEEPYKELSDFNEDGIAVALKKDGTYVQLNTKLEETTITQEKYQSFCLDPENDSCDAVFPNGDGDYSCVDDGLALYVEYKDGQAHVGLVDQDGNVIIPAIVPIYYTEMSETLHLSEDIAFVHDNATDKIGIITITRA